MSKALLPDGTITEWDERLRMVGAVAIEESKMKHRVKITQVFKTFRDVVVEVEAEDIDAAIDLLASGELTGPAFDDPRWKETWELMNEEVEAAK